MDRVSLFHQCIKTYDSLIPNLREFLSKNPAVTLQMVLDDIKQHPDKKHQWQFYLLSEHIPIKDLLQHFDMPTQEHEKCHVCMYGVIDMETVLKYQKRCRWYWRCLIQNKYITLEDIAAHPYLPWKYDAIIQNKNFRLHPVVVAHANVLCPFSINYKASYEQIKQYPELPWRMYCLQSPYITNKEHLYELYHKYAQTDPISSKMYIAFNPNLTVTDLYNLFGDTPEFYHRATQNPNFSLQDFLKYPSPKYDTFALSVILPIDYMFEHPEYHWFWIQAIYNNKTLRYEHINEKLFIRVKRELTAYKSEHYDSDAQHKSILNGFFSNPHVPSWDKKQMMDTLSLNELKEYPEILQRVIEYPVFLLPSMQKIREYFAKKKIIRHLVEVITNPAYKQCRKRLQREHSNLI